MALVILQGDVVERLREIPDGTVHCVVTSPPYWGLRDYGIEGQFGLEKTPEEYVQKMVGVFKEVWRVLRDDGTVWLNMGDCYSGSGKGPSASLSQPHQNMEDVHSGIVPTGLKPKDLVGMPWRLAFALQKEGWYLRSDIIWSKPNPMPESVTDRPTKSHEYIFLLTKKARYFYDADAIREPHQTSTFERATRGNSDTHKNLDVPGREVHTMHLKRAAGEGMEFPTAGRNRRTVWEIATQPFPEAHFATFPEALVEPCIKAGTSERGCCPVCGAPWERVVEKDNTLAESRRGTRGYESRGLEAGNRFASETPGYTTISKTLGWQPTCKCEGYYDFDQEKWFDYQKAIPCTVLDPFMGSGTTLKVARDLKRDAIGIEINPEYVKIARERLRLNEQLVSE